MSCHILKFVVKKFMGWIYVMDPRLKFPLNIKQNVFNYVYVRRLCRSAHGFYSVSGDVFLCDIRPIYRGVVILKNVTTIWKMLCNNRPKICILDVNIFFWIYIFIYSLEIGIMFIHRENTSNSTQLHWTCVHFVALLSQVAFVHT